MVTDVREILPDVRVSVGNGNRCEHCNTVIRPFVELTPVAVNVGGGNVEIKGGPPCTSFDIVTCGQWRGAATVTGYFQQFTTKGRLH